MLGWPQGDRQGYGRQARALGYRILPSAATTALTRCSGLTKSGALEVQGGEFVSGCAVSEAKEQG